MTYQQTIDFLYSQLPLFSNTGKAAIKEGLHNIEALCAALGNPQNQFKSIHIAGTNGKGSCSHCLAAILQESGYKTGLYTSPHIKDFAERIRINGEKIDHHFVVNFAEETQVLIEKIKPSFFEITVAMAFAWFADQKADIAIIETGLGGRLDSTNILQPILSIITNISFDHMNILGNSLAAIAYEKAGIIKNNTPVIIGAYTPETKPVFEQKIKEANAPVTWAQDAYRVSGVTKTGNLLECDVTDMHTHFLEHYVLDLTGRYQAENIKTVLAAEKVLRTMNFTISNASEKYALSHVKQLTGLLGRWDIIQENPTIIVDVGHNEAGIQYIISQLENEYPNQARHFILGFVKDKEIDAILDLFPKRASYYFTQAQIPRAFNCRDLQKKAHEKNLIGMGYANVNEALQAAKEKAAEDDTIIICGSFFIIAELDGYGEP
ncbi:MAG: dihydrofolate synthase [Niastella sp. SCN 39-18]|nr:bifunctional folylpolyglutamate synthase/dihydrofolate synthase [Sphingobacteriales bacterium]ODT51596.1 MAG: dihydrofolate synthase [Niastella sp. SCN 39-18]OJW08267.1 MAG: dihydrofolate synthase [Sphingobacteriales bacterium 39-19]